MSLSNIQKAKELKNNANLIVRRTDELDKAINKRESLQREFDRRIKHLDNKIETLSKKIEELKRMIIDRAYETGISRWLDDLHRKYGYKNTEETIEALGFSEYGEEAKIIRYGVENYIEEQEKGLRDNSNHIALLKTQAFNNEENKVAFKYKH
ncbi:hypothetical protein JP0160_01180 [Helicobacter pylori]